MKTVVFLLVAAGIALWFMTSRTAPMDNIKTIESGLLEAFDEPSGEWTVVSDNPSTNVTGFGRFRRTHRYTDGTTDVDDYTISDNGSSSGEIRKNHQLK